MNADNIPAASHHDLSSQYDGAANLTVAYFVVCGVFHIARRFFRADMPGTGKIELYTKESYPGADFTTCTEAGWYGTAFGEDFLRYVDEFNPSRVDSIAMTAIAAAAAGTYVTSVSHDATVRASLIELG